MAPPSIPFVARFDTRIDEDLVTEQSAAALIHSADKTCLRGAELWRRVTGRSFDLILIAHHDQRYQLLQRPLRHRELQLAEPAIAAWLVCGVPTPRREFVRLVTGIDSLARRTLRRTRACPVPSPIAAETMTRAAGRPIVVLAPGGARNAARTSPLKRWPLERYGSLASALHARGYAVAIVGDDSEAWVRDAFATEWIIDLVGRTTLSDLLSLFQQCHVVVAHDSGPLHLASLVRAPVVALFDVATRFRAARRSDRRDLARADPAVRTVLRRP